MKPYPLLLSAALAFASVSALSDNANDWRIATDFNEFRVERKVDGEWLAWPLTPNFQTFDGAENALRKAREKAWHPVTNNIQNIVIPYITNFYLASNSPPIILPWPLVRPETRPSPTNAVVNFGPATAVELLTFMRGETNYAGFVRLLVSSGEVCRIRGHLWESGCGIPGCLVMHAGSVRHCNVCGATQTQQLGPWQ